MVSISFKLRSWVRTPASSVLGLDVIKPQRRQGTMLRFIVSWQPDKKKPCLMIVTNLPCIRYSADIILRLYQLRRQIELLFKGYKSYAQLRIFRTTNPSIAESLVWAAVAAATLQRFMAHLAQQAHAVEVSTQKAAKTASAALSGLFKALVNARQSRIHKAFKAALDYLAISAQHAHPRWDRHSGRLQIGLDSVGVAA